MKSQWKITVCCLCLSLGLFFTCRALAAPAAKPIELKFGYFMPSNIYNIEKAIAPWGKMVEDATHGKVKIVHYPSESLFKVRDALTAVESGLADIIHTPILYFPGRFNLTEVLTVPFLLKSSSPEVNSRIIQTLYDAVPEIQKEYATMKLLFIFTSDPYRLAASKRPVRNLNDLKGLKIRTVGKYPTRSMNLLGASPVNIPVGETYEALSKGVIDGTLLQQAMIPDFRLHEVTHYWTDVALWPSIIIHAMNLEKWKSLPPDVQQGIMSVSGMKGGEFVAREGWGAGLGKFNEELIRKDKQKWERVELDKGELEKWKKTAGQPVWNEWTEDMNKLGLPAKKIMDQTVQLVEKYK